MYKRPARISAERISAANVSLCQNKFFSVFYMIRMDYKLFKVVLHYMVLSVPAHYCTTRLTVAIILDGPREGHVKHDASTLMLYR